MLQRVVIIAVGAQICQDKGVSSRDKTRKAEEKLLSQKSQIKTYLYSYRIVYVYTYNLLIFKKYNYVNHLD